MSATLMDSHRYIGLMSGTSADGIDAVVVEFDTNDRPTVLATATLPLPSAVKTLVERVVTGRDSRISTMKSLDQDLGAAFAAAANKVAAGVENIRAIGSHGQTVLHRPELGFSIQLGSGGLIADLTGIDTVNDFRAADLALGGEGAPLVPAFHHSVFTSPEQNRVIVNIGGIANISWLPASGNNTFGFDTGPGNTLLDYWAQQTLGQAFDADGDLARQGTLHEALLARCLADPYFGLPHPKSTGRERFNGEWLSKAMAGLGDIPDADVQATLVELTARSIVDAVHASCPKAHALYICGGGVRNGFLMQRLAALSPGQSVSSTDAIGLDPAWVECIAFAWLARQHVHGKPGNLPAVTGARRATILGNYWPG